MKRQDLVKYQQMNQQDLQAEIRKLETYLIEFTMKKNMAQVKNVREGKSVRHDIARLKTIAHQAKLTTKTADNKEQV